VGRCHLDAGHLATRVYAGIGAAGAVHGDRGTFESRERLLQEPLNGIAFGLALPADEPRAVVGDGQLEYAAQAFTACDIISWNCWFRRRTRFSRRPLLSQA
jgi:hypothetical protein